MPCAALSCIRELAPNFKLPPDYVDSSVIFLPEKAHFELLSSFRHPDFVYIAELELGGLSS